MEKLRSIPMALFFMSRWQPRILWRVWSGPLQFFSLLAFRVITREGLMSLAPSDLFNVFKDFSCSYLQRSIAVCCRGPYLTDVKFALR